MFGVCIYRKKLFTSVNFFIHLNLSISLLLALTVFVSGIETATINQVIMNLHVTAWNNDSVFFKVKLINIIIYLYTRFSALWWQPYCIISFSVCSVGCSVRGLCSISCWWWSSAKWQNSGGCSSSLVIV